MGGIQAGRLTSKLDGSGILAQRARGLESTHVANAVHAARYESSHLVATYVMTLALTYAVALVVNYVMVVAVAFQLK